MPKSAVLLHRINNHTTPTTVAMCGTTTTSSSSSVSVPSHHGQPQQRSPLSCAADEFDIKIPDTIFRYHTHDVNQNQVCSAVIQEINAPIPIVWSVVRRFDNPQAYKHFVKSCRVLLGDGDVGTLRQVHVISGLPAATSTERLEILDDERHVMSFSVVGGDHRLSNYRSVTTLHQSGEGSTIVVESYVVDIPTGNTKEETCVFVDTIVRCNLQSLAQIAENLARRENNRSGQTSLDC